MKEFLLSEIVPSKTLVNLLEKKGAIVYAQMIRAES